MALEGHQKQIIGRHDAESDDDRPDNKNLRSEDGYLFEKYYNVNLQQPSRKNVCHLSTILQLAKIKNL